ncbi:hypothetical protein FJT64_020365 [Amphibalanus amphitrite]|uniref:Zonadhesin n=1 Tax=Amphibalanus amphitrite TaxID=1232801 RepID=A0A6A4X274_AMPAM|nr:hypothetical protein FJT64_020365 [Amphibalanus amphitrite]
MLAALCLCLLVTAARAQLQQLDGNYLPPNPDGGENNNRYCPPAKTITSYSDRLVVDTQTRVVSQPVVDYVTSTVISSQVVPSVIVRTSVFRSTVVVPQEVVRTSNVVRYVTRTVQVPGAVRQVVRTSEQVVRSTVIRQLTTTLETTQLRTSVQFRTQTRTIFVTSTQIVPQVSVFTERRPVPGPNVVVTRTEEVLKTRVVSQPSAPVVSTFVQEEVRFRTVPVQVPGAVRTSTVIQQSQRVIPVESEVVVPQVNTVEVTSARQFERTLYKTYTSQQVVPVQVVNTQYVDSRIVKTQQIQVTNTDIRVNTNFVTVTEPAREVVSVVYRTDVNVVTQPGNVIPVVRTQTVEQVVNREVLSTRVIPNVVVRTKFIDLPCKSRGGGGYGRSHGGYGGYGSSNDGGCNPATGAGCGGSNDRNVGNTFVSGGNANCPQDRVVTVPRVSTSVQQIVRTVQVPQVNTQVVTQTTLVPSFVTSTVVSTDIGTRVEYLTRTETNVDTQQVVSTVRLPDQVNTVTQTVYRTELGTEYNTQTQYVTRQDVRTSVSVVNTQVQVPTVVQVPRLQVSTQVVPVPGPAQTQLRTVYNTREITSYYQVPAETIVKTSIQYRTEVVSQPVRQPDTYVTVTSVNVVPVTSIVYRTRVVPQYVTNTKNVANTVTRTSVTTQLVPVRSTIVQNVVNTRFVTDYVTDTQRVVRTEVKQVYNTVRVPSQPRVVYRTEVVQVASTVRGADTYNTQIVTVPVQREVYNTRIVDQVQNQERVVTQKRGGGYCGGGGGGHAKGYGGYHRY